jgi:hypothetical protein
LKFVNNCQPYETRPVTDLPAVKRAPGMNFADNPLSQDSSWSTAKLPDIQQFALLLSVLGGEVGVIKMALANTSESPQTSSAAEEEIKDLMWTFGELEKRRYYAEMKSRPPCTVAKSYTCDRPSILCLLGVNGIYPLIGRNSGQLIFFRGVTCGGCRQWGNYHARWHGGEIFTNASD